MAARSKILATPRKRPNQARSQATVEAILESAAHILSSEGYEALTTNAIAARAGVSIGSLYQYFPTKEAIIAELVEIHHQRLLALFGEMFLKVQTLSPKRAAYELVNAFYQIKRTDPRLARALRDQLPRLSKLNLLEGMLDRIAIAVGGYLEERRSALRIDDPARAAFYVVHLVDDMVMTVTSKRPNDDPARIVADITEIVTRYLFK